LFRVAAKILAAKLNTRSDFYPKVLNKMDASYLMPVPGATGEQHNQQEVGKMSRYAIVWGYATSDGYKVEVETASNVLEAERKAGRLHGVVVPAENVEEVIKKLEAFLKA